MRHNRLMNALKKAGALITWPSPTKFVATKGDNRIEWFTQPNWRDETKLDAICVNSPSPHTDVMTDLFCDTFHDTIKQAVEALDW